MGAIKLGKILGFEISIDWSWLLIFFLVVYTLASGYFPFQYPQFSPALNWGLAVLSAILLFVSVLIHEISHSILARHYGGNVRGIMLFLFGGVSQTSDEPKAAREEFWMAIAGPMTSFILAAIFYGLFRTGIIFDWPLAVNAVLSYLAFINFILAVFNLIPGFPLDGGRVLRSIIWSITDDLEKSTRYASYTGQAFGYLLVAVGLVSVFSGAFIGGLWLAFIGWFLAGAARTSYQQLLMKQALSGLRVEQVMTTDVPVIPAEMSVRDFVDTQLLRHDYSCYPVVRNDEVVGVIGAEEVRTINSDLWNVTSVLQIVHPIGGAYKISPNDDAWEALAKLSSEDICRLLVMENEHLKGTVGRETVYRVVRAKMQYGT